MRKSILLLSFVCFGTQLFAQAASAGCDNTVGAQLTPSASCTPIAWNSNNNTDYWDDSWFWGACNEDDFDDAWGWFTASSTTTTITYTASAGDPILTVFTGACSPFYSTNVACSDLTGNAGTETVTMATVPGTVYHVRIQNYSSNATMTGTICVVGTTGGGSTTASDCSSAVNVCTDLSFSIDPNGFGAINEIPAAGSFGNPFYGPLLGDPANPWGTTNMGCLRSGEYNSTWMIVNVATSGNLQFTIGAGGAQAGYYDWIMYPYSGPATCTAVSSNTLAPVRCNWNGTSAGGTGLVSTLPAGGDATNYEPPLPVTAGQRYLIVFSNYSNSTTTVPLQFLTGAGDAGVSCTPLGFELKDMLIVCEDDSRVVSWKIPVTTTIDKMILQKSRDGQNWENLGDFTQTQEDETGYMNFAYSDDMESNVLAYYRIRQEMSSGAVEFSNVISADCDNSNDPFEVYPNPANSLLNVEYKSMTETALEFYTLTGERVYKVDLPKAEKRTKGVVNTEDVVNGVYILKMKLNDEVFTSKVVIAH